MQTVRLNSHFAVVKRIHDFFIKLFVPHFLSYYESNKKLQRSYVFSPLFWPATHTTFAKISNLTVRKNCQIPNEEVHCTSYLNSYLSKKEWQKQWEITCLLTVINLATCPEKRLYPISAFTGLLPAVNHLLSRCFIFITLPCSILISDWIIVSPFQCLSLYLLLTNIAPGSPKLFNMVNQW